jgi:FkbM family methyltransferase
MANSRVLQLLKSGVARFVREIKNLCAAGKSLGLGNAARFAWIRFADHRKWNQGAKWGLRVRGWPHRVGGRYGTSDLSVFEQIFIREEHRWAKQQVVPVRDMLILDCGANVGYSTIYFLRLFPSSTVVAVEPDVENYAMLASNLSHGNSSITLLRAAVWSCNTSLQCSNLGFRDGQHWSRQVRLANHDEDGVVASVTVSGLLELSGLPRISILKMDIEGAEAEVFSKDPSIWLRRTDAVAVELHDDTNFGDAPRIVTEALARENFKLSTCGELTVAQRAL